MYAFSVDVPMPIEHYVVVMEALKWPNGLRGFTLSDTGSIRSVAADRREAIRLSAGLGVAFAGGRQVRRLTDISPDAHCRQASR